MSVENKVSNARRPFIGGNWKMYGTKASVTALTTALMGFPGKYPANVEVVVAPTALHLDYVMTKLTGTGIEVTTTPVSYHVIVIIVM
jgi:triosephosphate isomerase